MKDQISSYQWLAMLTAPLFPLIMMNEVTLLVSETGRGAYLSILLISLLTFPLLAAVIGLQKKNQYASPLPTAAAVAGQSFSRIIAAITGAYFLCFSVIALSIFIYIVKIFFLPQTPVYISAFILFLPSAYMAYCGLRSFTHMATTAVIAMVLFLLIFLFTKNNYLPANLFPLTDFKTKDIVTSLPFLFLTAPAAAATFFVLPYAKDRCGLLKKSAFFCGVMLILLLFVYAMAMMYFGENVLTHLVLPFYNLSPIFKGNLLERFDIVFMLILLPSLTILTSFGFSIFTIIQQELFVKLNARHFGSVVSGWSLITIIASIFFFYHLPLWKCYYFCNAGAFGILLVYCVIYLVAAAKRRKKSC